MSPVGNGRPRDWTWKDLCRIFSDRPPIASLLPWRWVEEDTIHALADGSLGMAWQIPILDAELLDEEGRAPLAAAFEALINRLPVGAAFQALCFSRPGLGPALERWAAPLPVPADPFVAEVIRAREQTLRQETFFGDYQGRQTVVLFTVRLWPSRPQRTLWQRLRAVLAPFIRVCADALGFLGIPVPEHLLTVPTLARDQHEWRTLVGQLRRIADLVHAQTTLAGVVASPLGGQAFLGIAWRMLNPTNPGRSPRWNPDEPLSSQAVGSEVTIYQDRLTLDTLEGRVLSLKALPPETWPGMLTLARFAGGTGGCLALPGTSLLSASGSVVDQERAVGGLRVKKMFAWQQRFTLFGDTSPEAAHMREELDRLLTRSFAAGTRLSQVAFHLTLFDAPSEISRTVEAALGALAQVEAQPMVERLLTGPTWLGSLPFGYDPALERFLRRARRVMADNLADLLPIYGSFRGTKTPAQLFLDRRGEAVGFNPFDAADVNAAAHCLITGVTGSGKSFQTVDLILQHLRRGADIFVLDKGDSYRRLAELVGGRYLAITPNDPLTINPCAGDGSKEHQAFLTLVIAEMASGGDKRFELDREGLGVLAKAVAETFQAPPAGRELVLSDVVRTLANDPDPDRIGPKIARRLYPFTREGSYGRFFDGPNQFQVSHGLTVVELKEVSAYPDLQTALMLVLLERETSFVTGQPKELQKFLIVDESWNLLQSENAAKVLETAVRTYRKAGCAAVFISQYLTDFEGPAGRAIRENCPHRLFLRQEPDALAQVKKLIGLTPREEALLRSVGSRKGAFSEGLLVTPFGSGIVRLIVDPLTYWTATTAPEDAGRLADTIRKTGALRPAVFQLAGVAPDESPRPANEEAVGYAAVR